MQTLPSLLPCFLRARLTPRSTQRLSLARALVEKKHFVIQALEAIPVDASIRLNALSAMDSIGLGGRAPDQFDYLLVQTDGSFLSKNDHAAGGV